MTPFEKLDALYATLPTMIDCKRKCADSCGPLLIPEVELRRLEQRNGFIDIVPIGSFKLNPQWRWSDPRDWRGMKPEKDGMCRFLTFGKCRMYSIRPLICRIWGATEGMRCHHGCVPTRWLSLAEVKALTQEIFKLQKETTSGR